MLAINSKPITRLAFTPIIPHPVTEYDAIFAAMVNFQNVDVLQQRGMSCGLFCSDEETYRLAKEFQLNHPERFDNIFLWIGGFHMEKIIIACCGKYLVESGINRVLVADKIFGLQVVKSVMEGSHYLGGKWGMEIIAVFMEHLQLSTFFNATDTNKYRDLFLQLTQLQSLFHANDTNLHLIGVAWGKLKDDIENLLEDLDSFSITGSSKIWILGQIYQMHCPSPSWRHWILPWGRLQFGEVYHYVWHLILLITKCGSLYALKIAYL